MSLVPVPAEQSSASCSNCGAALVADQRYCLNCGRPCSPVRLAFLDALTPDAGGRGGQAPAWGPGTSEMGPSGLLPVEAGRGTNAWLRRNSGLLALLAILLLCVGIGLLVGHWASQKTTAAAGPSVIKIEGNLGGLAAGASGTGTSSTPSATESSTGATKSGSKTEAKEAAEGAKETKAEKAPPPKPVKITKSKLSKLTTSHGKKHQEEINSLGAAPIETG